MSNSLLVTSDLRSVVLIDSLKNDQKLSIGKRGVLLSVLGSDICATEVPASLEKFVDDTANSSKAFYEFDASDAIKNQLCITYNDGNNTVFIIGITDVIANLSGPTEIPQNKVKTFSVKMKNNTNTGLTSPSVILVRLETIGIKRLIRFYYLPSA